jgi:Membrane proteins related to metalloendopeptidases
MVKKICLGLLAIMLIFVGIFSFQINYLIQQNSIINTGFFRFFKDGEFIANIHKLDDIKMALSTLYGEKADEDIYFGAGVTVEYVAYEEAVELTNPLEIIAEINPQVNGLLVRTQDGKEFFCTSYRAWQSAVAGSIEFIKNNDIKNNGQTIIGDIKIAEDFTFSYEYVPISEVRNVKELQKELLYNNVLAQREDVIQVGDTISSIAERNGVSEQQIIFTNALTASALLVPGAKLDVSELNYAVDFSYPTIENMTEEIPFEIEYVDDDTKYEGEEEIIQEGINGLANAQYLSNIVNGEIVPRERLEYEIISEPVKQIVSRGTRIAPSFSGGGDAPHSNIAGFIWPARGICISAEFGWYAYGAHRGLDIAGSTGESIWAVAAGRVEIAGFDGSFGYNVMINHRNGLKTRYAHLSSLGVNVGQEVEQGNYLGGMGTTGMSDGVHLHFEVHVDGDRLNPRGYLPSGGPRAC